MHRLARTLSLCAASLLLAGAPAAAHLLSTASDEVIDGKTFFSGDLFAATNVPGSSGLYLGASIFEEDAVDINAAALLPNGNLLLSVGNDGGATVGGIHVDDGDLFEYDPETGAASLYLDEAVFGVNVDIDAVEILPNGHLVLSVRRDDVIHGTLFRDGDLIEYDPSAGTFSLFMSESVVGGADIDGFARRAGTGHYLISTQDTATIGTLTFPDDAVVDYAPVSGAVFIVLTLDSRTTGGGSDVDAIINGGPIPCSDGLDNDGDGLVDFGADPGCDAAGDLSETGTAPCDDGADNDGDGLIDLADPICTSIASPTEYAQCQDGNDNDHDGMVDFDGGVSVHGVAIAPPDTTCQGNPARKERIGGSACGLGFEAGLVLPMLFAIRAARRRAARC